MKNLHFTTVKHCFFSNSMILIDILSGNPRPLPYIYIYINYIYILILYIYIIIYIYILIIYILYNSMAFHTFSVARLDCRRVEGSLV